MSGPDAASAAFCLDLVRSHDFDRYAATLFTDADRRRALLALYAFNVEIVRVREQVSQPLPGEIRLQWWTDMLAGSGHGGVEGNPVAAELLYAIERYALPVAPLARLIEAHLFDLYNDPMPDLVALETYLAETSSPLIGLAAQIYTAPSEAIDHAARHAGIALGIVRVIDMLPFDAARRQLFVPLNDFERHGGNVEDLFAGRATPPLRATLDGLLDKARGHVDAATTLLRDLPREVRGAFLLLALVDSDLKRLTRTNYNPMAPEPRSRLRTLWTLWRNQLTASS